MTTMSDLSTWVWPAVLVLGLGLLVTGLCLLRRAPGATPPDGRATPGREAPGTAHAVLAERHTRGEIDDAEYARRRSVLDER